MSGVRCRVSKVDVGGVLRKVVAAKKRATVMMTEAARMDTRPYVPRVSGALVRTGDTESKPEQGLLIYGNAAVNYARAQYFGLPNKTTEKHPQATKEWFTHSKAANGRKWRNVAAQQFKKGLK